MSNYKNHKKEVRTLIEDTDPPEGAVWYFQSWERDIFEIDNDDLNEDCFCILFSKEAKHVTI